MIVLKIIGWILLGIVALIVIALSLKIRIEVEYSDENTSVVLRVLFLRIPLYPLNKKAKGTSGDGKRKPENISPGKSVSGESNISDENEATETVDENPDTVEEVDGEAVPTEKPVTASKKKSGGIKELLQTVYNAEGVDGLMLITRRTVNYFGTFFGSLLRWIVVDEFDVDVCCTKEDAAATAIYYGEVCSVLFPMLGSLASKCRLKNYNINVYPDYIARFSSASFILKFYFIPIVLVGHIIALVLKLVFRVALQLLVKIFLYMKNGKSTGDSNKNIKEKSEVTNE